MSTTYIRPGQLVFVRDCFGKTWPAIYRGEIPRDRTGVYIEIRGELTRAERKNLLKA